jgi:hypothetical protein
MERNGSLSYSQELATGPCHNLFICGLFKKTVSSSEYGVNDRMINE